MVVAPRAESLNPTILIYNPEMDRSEALAVDLAKTPDLKIEEALRPASLPTNVLDWINPRQRFSCFFTVEKSS